MSKTTVTDRLLRPEQVARRLGLSPASVRKLIATGALAFTNVGSATRKRYRVHESEVDGFMRRRARQPGSNGATSPAKTNQVFISTLLPGNLPAGLGNTDRLCAIGNYVVALHAAAIKGVSGLLPERVAEAIDFELLARAGLAQTLSDGSIRLKLGPGFAAIMPPGEWPEEDEDERAPTGGS